MMHNELLDIARGIQLVIFDVDGVMTDGKLYLSEQQEQFKAFHVHDGLGIKLLLRAGITPAVISARQSPIVKQRFTKLGVTHIYMGYENKTLAFQALLAELNFSEHEIAFVGDDWLDIPIMQRVGLPVAVANATAAVKQCALWETKLSGGQGAVREVCEGILAAQNQLARLLSAYQTA